MGGNTCSVCHQDLYFCRTCKQEYCQIHSNHGINQIAPMLTKNTIEELQKIKNKQPKCSAPACENLAFLGCKKDLCCLLFCDKHRNHEHFQCFRCCEVGDYIVKKEILCKNHYDVALRAARYNDYIASD